MAARLARTEISVISRQSNLGNHILREVSELISSYITEPQVMKAVSLCHQTGTQVIEKEKKS